jgi:hypothetical protein
MADVRKRIMLSIRNEVDGDLEGPYEILLGWGESLFARLEGYRPVANWYNVRSVNMLILPHLNWTVADHAAAETEATVNSWASIVLTQWSREHRLTLTTNPLTTNARVGYGRGQMEIAAERLPSESLAPARRCPSVTLQEMRACLGESMIY